MTTAIIISSSAKVFRALVVVVVLCAAIMGCDARRHRGRAKTPQETEGYPVRNDHMSTDSSSAGQRGGRIFSLFNVVTFPNTACPSTSTTTTGSNRNGTCLTSNECVSQGGSMQGTCAAGFGVCCVFTFSAGGATITRNSSYIQNPGFPQPSNGGMGVTYTVNKASSDVCFLRLDFDTFTILGTGNTMESNGGECQDVFSVTTTNTGGRPIPEICGQNTGQHIYVDVGTMASDSATLSFMFLGSDMSNRQWEIQVTQLECFNQNAPPNGCLQFSTGVTGRFTTFNFLDTADNHLRSQDYSHCIRQESGSCCIQFQTCASEMNQMSLNAANPMTKVDSECTLDYIAIPGSDITCSTGNAVITTATNRYCSLVLSNVPMGDASVPICDCTPPFQIDVFTDALADDGSTAGPPAAPSRGTCLEWTQLPC